MVAYSTEQIAQALKAAREGKGLSQRALAKLAGVPQSHISKIESGAVDLRLSSLVEIARALDLEVTLVPRKTVSAVNSIVRSTQPAARQAVLPGDVARELKRLQKSLGAALREHPGIKEIAQLQRQARELQRLALPFRDLEALREATRTVQAFKESTKGLEDIRRTVADLKSLRNAAVHSLPRAEAVKPAYSLEEDDHG